MKNFKKLRALIIYCLTAFLLLFMPVQVSFAASLNQGLKAAQNQDWNNAQEILQKLRRDDQAALTWFLAYQQSPSLSFETIKTFLDAHPDWPLQARLTIFAEKQMPETLPPAEVISWFEKYPARTADGAIFYSNALMRAGQNKKAKEFINEWWTYRSLSREDQKKIFSAFDDSLERSAHIARLHMLLDEGDAYNARAVAALTGQDYQALAAARIALQNKSGDVNARINAVKNSLQNEQGFLLDRLTWRRKKDLDEGAIAILMQASALQEVREPKQWWKERHIIVRRLMEKKDYKKAYKLARAHKQKEGFPQAQAEWVSGFLALEYLGKNWEAFEHFEKLYHSVSSPISRARGAYWAGLASERLGHPEIAAQWFNKAAAHGETFYGQLAAEKTGQKPRLHFTVAGSGAKSPLNTALEKAAKAFTRARLNDEAEIFLHHLGEVSKTARDYKEAAQTATQAGFPHIAIAITQDSIRDGHWLGQLAYPQRTSDLRHIKDVEWALIHGLIRQESRFDQYARSPAGALGLMQLMPGTARETARKEGVGYKKQWLVSKPDYNIKLGSSYIQRMVDRYGGHYALALAAYNAGPGRVDRWIVENGDPRQDGVDLIKWIEEIPIYETRNYVQRVLEAVYVYRQKLKSKQPPPRYPIHIAMR